MDKEKKVRMPKFTLADAKEMAKKHGRLAEFNQLRRDGWFSPGAIMFAMGLPVVYDGVEYWPGKGKANWQDLIETSKQYATGKGMQSGFRWLEDAFNECFEEHESLVESGKMSSFGGPTGSLHNREVLMGKILAELGNGVGGQHVLNEKELQELKKGLQNVIQRSQMSNGLKI